LSLVEIEFGQI